MVSSNRASINEPIGPNRAPLRRAILYRPVGAQRSQHPVSTAAEGGPSQSIWRGVLRRRHASRESLLEALDAELGEGGHAILADAVDAQAGVFGNMSIEGSHSHFVVVEGEPGAAIVVAAWMLDPAVCAAMAIGAAHVSAEALVDLHLGPALTGGAFP
jgi:hypothetical protein